MKYWDEMLSKWGFNDGAAQPPDARACRQVYVREINRLAEERHSKVRFFAYDRPGMHNSCMVLPVSAQYLARLAVPGELLETGDWDPPADYKEPELDQAMNDAISDAYGLDLDGYVETTVKIRKRK